VHGPAEGQELQDVLREGRSGAMQALSQPWRRTDQAAPNKLDLAVFCGCIALLCIAGSYPSLSRSAYFLGDDFGLIHHLHDKPLARFLTYFSSDWTEGIYGVQLDELRPFLALSYRVDSWWGAANPLVYHLTNLILHYLNSLMVGAIAFLMGHDRWTAMLASALFALAACHAETIGWISGRVDSIAALFYLAAFLLFALFRIRGSYRWYLFSLVVFGFGLYAKQTLMVLPALLVAFDLVYDRRSDRSLGARVLTHLPFAATLLLHLAVRHALFGQAVRENQIKLEIFREFALRQGVYLRYLFLPITTAPFDRLTKMVMAVAIAALYAVCGLLGAKALRSEPVRSILFFGVVWYVISVSPLLVTYPSARHLYIPSAGFSIALAALLLPARPVLSSRTTLLRVTMIAGILVLNGVALHAQTVSWLQNGLQSRTLASAIPALFRAVPRDAILVVDVPRTSRDLWLWSFSFPYVLQRPFVSEDLYSQYRVIESPDIYCCPLQKWWDAKRQVLQPLSRMPAEEMATIYAIRGDGNQGAPVLTAKSTTAGQLRTRLAAALHGESLEDTDKLSWDQARDLLEALQR
jgi:hypothetical protein